MLLWDPIGNIVNAAINMPGSFHDSKATLYANLYSHIADFPEPFCIICDSAFQTGGKLGGKIFKTKLESAALILSFITTKPITWLF